MDDLPRRVEVVALPKCQSLKADGQAKCSKAVMGAASLAHHGLTDHELAGKACWVHIVGRDAFIAQGLETRRVRKREREMGLPAIFVDANQAPAVAEETVETPALGVYGALRQGDDQVTAKFMLRRRFGPSTP